jgi:hypothetical protein
MPDASVQPGEGTSSYNNWMSSTSYKHQHHSHHHPSYHHQHHPKAMSSKESEMAQRLLDKADDILAQIDDAFIVKQRGHVMRPMPTFRPEELTLSQVLGIGGFCIVNEVKNIVLDDDVIDNEKHTTTAANNNNNDNAHPLVMVVEKDKDDKQSNGGDAAGVHSDDSLGDNHEIDQARKLMQRRVLRNGVGRYALKRLHGSLTELERARGMIDLAVEAKYLAVVRHPNIIKIRGIAAGPMVGNGFFILIDRLFMTLDRKINEWHKQHRQYKGGLLGFGKNRNSLKDLMVERMTVAYDLAAAFFYLHENR